MRHERIDNWPTAAEYLKKTRPDDSVYFFSPRRLCATHLFFSDIFPGTVTYAVKANDHVDVLRTLAQAGMTAFDVASVVEMAKVRSVSPNAQLHYHNPVRSQSEIAIAKTFGVRSWSIDCLAELDKLGDLPPGSEIAVRFKLPMQGAAYDFGEKFGTTPENAASLLQAVVARGFVPCLTFHPGTQCTDVEAWARYIHEAARIAEAAQVRIARLNVGGGFASDRGAEMPDLEKSIAHIAMTHAKVFASTLPELVCEPGRSMVANSFAVGLCVKAIRPDGSLILNDGIYGALAEWRDMVAVGSRLIAVYSADGTPKTSPSRPRVVFGPTCDSLDRVDQQIALPNDIEEGDYIVIQGMGAYSLSLACGFNGYGQGAVVKTEDF